MTRAALLRALDARDEVAVLTQASAAIDATEAVLRAGLPALLTRIVDKSGAATARVGLRLAFNPDQARDDHGEWTAGTSADRHATFHGVMEGFGDKLALFNVHDPGGSHHQSTVSGETLLKLKLNIPPVPAQHGVFDATGRFIAEPQTTPAARPPGPWDANVRHAAAKIQGWQFDANSPEAIAWAQDHATDLISGISKTTREDIKGLIDESLHGDLTAADLANQIDELIGDDARAETIARTETMRASNAGQQLAWDQAAMQGLLSGNEQKEWIVTPDDRLCPICEPMDGVTVDLDESFDVDGEEIDEPPAHPNCRCTTGLVLER